MSLALISVHSSGSQLLHNTTSLLSRRPTGFEKTNPLGGNFIYFLLTAAKKEALLGFSNPRNHAGVSLRRRIPPIVDAVEAQIGN